MFANPKLKTFYKISGLALVVGCSFFMKTNYAELEVYKNGYFVNATIVFVPDCISTRAHYNIKFKYNEKIYAKGIGVLTCKKLKEGDAIRLKTNSDNSVFLYENESPFKNTVAFLLLFLFGVYLLYVGFKKTKG